MKRSIAPVFLLVLAAAAPVSATTLDFSDRTAWAAMVTNLSNFDGGVQAVGTSSTIINGGLFSTNLQINGYGIDLFTPMDLIRANAGPSQSYYNWNSGTIIRTQDKTPTNTVFARISFPTPVTAFGFNYGVGGCQTYFVGCLPGAAASVTIAPDGLAPININTVQGNTLAFWGVVSDSQTFSFADIYINDPNRYIVMDDIAQGSYSPNQAPPSEVAEPGTILQIAMGAGLLALARRRFQLTSQQSI
jgi:hypothetical protein